MFYHTNPAADFTVNLTSVPTDDNRSFSIALIIVQGATARMPNALQIDGTAQSYSTLGGQGLLGTANGVDVVNYTFVRNTADSTGWTVLASTADYRFDLLQLIFNIHIMRLCCFFIPTKFS